ncbi:hypothetical protein D8674_014038 [Pyrus ussuriensis x Pyrus communis]|uniref:Reverse transcriptase Ty1/copia-type domain-containing protein n=1 Tax=Pyrus ussuriensis x Pyrus communis TaxID=2448454 RepID=A0A5N5GRF2_9ROSA|nr:hypothetical protein D8674_014038 [Pyrus ussuriensis x Pyrus communis]
MFPSFCLLQDIQTQEIIRRGTKRIGLYYVDDVAQGRVHQVQGLDNGKLKFIQLWHRRLVHASFASYSPSLHKRTITFELIHSDVWGPSAVTTQHGVRWFITFVDDCIRMTWLYLMKNKSDVGDIFKAFYHMVYTQYSFSVKVLRIDNGGEDYGWFNIMPTISVNSSNGLLDQIGPDVTNQTGPDKANCDCPDRRVDHGRRNGSGPCDAYPSKPHVVTNKNNDGSHADDAICNPNYDVVAVVYPSVTTNPSGPNRNYGVGPSGPSRVITAPNLSNSSIELKDNNKLPHTPTDIPKKELYMDIPPSYGAANSSGKVCRLRKTLYGPKQSPIAWFGRFTQTMKKYGYRQRSVDHTFFIKHKDGKVTLVIIYVDDMIVTGDDTMEIERLQGHLSSKFEMKDLGGLKYFLGIEVAKSQEGIYLSKRKYVLDLLSETGFKPKGFMMLYCDNQVAREIANNAMQHDRTKHVAVNKHFIKEKLDVKLVDISFVKTKKQLADILTHVVSAIRFQDSLDKLGLCDICAPT